MMRSALRWALRPRVFLPILLGVVLLFVLLALGNVREMVALLSGFQPRYLVAFVVALLGYETIRCLQWRFLLTMLGIRVPVRTQVITYITGEAMKSLPLGNFLPDYVLQRSQAAEFGRASSVTLAINLLEVAVTLVGLVVLGVSGWSWLRPLIVFGLAGFALVTWLITRWLTAMRARPGARYHLPALATRFVMHPSMRRGLEELRQFRAGGAALLRPRVLIPAALFSAAYLVLGGLELALLAWGLGLQQLTLAQALTVYFFSLAFATIIPLPMDLGSTELGGVGVFLALGVGVGKSAAVGVMVLDRSLALGATLALALVIGLVLQAEVRAELSSFARAPQPAPAAAEPRRPWSPRRRLLRGRSGARGQLVAPVMAGSGVTVGLEAPAYAVASCVPRTWEAEAALPTIRNALDRSPCRRGIAGSVAADPQVCGICMPPLVCPFDHESSEGHLAA